MPLSPDTSISHYRILSKIGEGGMGEVYRARDERLDRDVAIKLLPARFAGDEERLARFEQEAKATSALSHPNILAVHDIGEHDGSPYIVSELLEGEELRDRLAQGPIPVRKAVEFASQIASGLSAAHGKGIVHRDLKPENIFITTDERVKILDFGIAKLTEKDPVQSEDATRKALTDPGMVLGTAAYMSPEQVRGQKVDHRSDIFSFGAMLLEMVSGKQAFKRETMAETMAAILKEEPDERTLEGLDVDPAFLGIIRRCLEKRPDLRFQSTTDLGFALGNLTSGSGISRQYSGAPSTRKSRKFLPIPAVTIAAVALTALVTAALVWLYLGSNEDPHQGMVLSVLPPQGTKLPRIGSIGSILEISPDGSSLMIRAGRGLLVRNFDSTEFLEVPGSEGASNQPTWHGSDAVTFPNDPGNWRDIKLRDGAPVDFAEYKGFTRGGTWNGSGTLVFAASEDLHVASERGKAEKVSHSTGREGGFLFPYFITGTMDFLVFFQPDDGEIGEVWLATISGTEMTDVKVLLKNDTPARFTPYGGGNVLFVKDDNLYAQRLDLGSRALTGEARLLIKGVASQPSPDSARAEFSVSENGVIAWRSGSAATNQITVFDRSGKEIESAGPEGSFRDIVLSPSDGSRLFVTMDRGRSERSAMMEAGQGGLNDLPSDTRWRAWINDGKEIAGRRGDSIVARQVDTGQERVLGEAPPNLFRLKDISPDGRSVLGFCVQRGLVCVSTVSADGKFGEAKPIVDNTGEWHPNSFFSPDGRHILYRAQGGPSRGLYVQPFPGPGRRTLLSEDAGWPAWRADGKEIVYSDSGNLYSIQVSGGPDNLSFSEPKVLFTDLRYASNMVSQSRFLQISSDGSRIYWVQGAIQPDDGAVNVMFGF